MFESYDLSYLVMLFRFIQGRKPILAIKVWSKGTVLRGGGISAVLSPQGNGNIKIKWFWNLEKSLVKWYLAKEDISLTCAGEL